MSHLLLISLGPVQEFIASARRFRDLWFGSWLLSDLSRAAARAIVEAESLEALIFPAPDRAEDLHPGSELGVANKLLARLAGDPRMVAEKAREAAQARLMELAEEAFESLDARHVDLETARRQLADLIEWQWAAVHETDDYPADRRRLEALLAARKNTREFAPVAWGSDRPKSSLDGQREAVIDPELYGRKDERSADMLFERFGVRPGENLCGVGLLKRHGGTRAERIPSTSAVAARSALPESDPRATAAAENYGRTLCSLGVPARLVTNSGQSHSVLGRMDAQLLFEERLAEVVPAANLDLAQEALRAFRHEADLERPQPYYALLLADGDRMGQAIDRQQRPADHQRLTRSLASFAGEARRIVDAHGGHLVYAGGDDVLALMPLHTAIPCAQSLAEAFGTLLGEFGGPEGAPTLSVGLAIGHQMDPASETLELARRAEKQAKVTRNALAIAVQKRGGGEQLVSGTWGTLDRRMTEWITLFAQGAFPDGAAYELRDVAGRLPPTSHALHAPMALAEATRILGRKRGADGAPMAVDLQKRLLEYLGVAQGSAPRLELAHLADELITARIFASAT